MPAITCKPAKSYKVNIMTLGVAMLLAGATTSGMFDVRSARADVTKDLRLLEEAKITLVEAIGIAEKHVGGTAIDADLDSHFGKVVYDISVIRDKKEFDVRLDAVTGDVIRMEEDKD
ncbi:MAG: PepSY domain-containing protein [Bdellovibrionales bacterium]|jgi:uncharacterized membrane protein YkoI|nr:PepSY domain-containing protein [Bdellovibrionales bacterium]